MDDRSVYSDRTFDLISKSEDNMPAFIDVTCQKCGKRFGWCGDFKDRPPCPKCGYQIPKSELEADDLEIQRMEELIFAKKDYEEALQHLVLEIKNVSSNNAAMELATNYIQNQNIDLKINMEALQFVVSKIRGKSNDQNQM